MNIGVVVIGRNEGERLRKCLESVMAVTGLVAYVDSGSTDGSVTMVRGMGLDVVELDMSVPFTAARARNEGSRRLLESTPGLEYIQFVDGDCELVAGWMEAAAKFLKANQHVAVVCGRLRERYPERSIYNTLCDMEWDSAVGQTRACGGIAMMRTDAFVAAGGFREGMIAGEEPELCVRLRAKGWQIWRLDAEMAWHDAAMTRFAQWWKRAKRGGYACAEGAYLHGKLPEQHKVTESRRIWIWGLAIPVVSVGSIYLLGGWGLGLLLVYPLQVVRLALKGVRSGRENWLRAFFLVLGKFPEVMGQSKFLLDRLTGKASHLIEYK